MIDCTKCIYFELEGIEGVCKHFGMVIDDAEPCSCTAFTKEENNLPDRLRFRFWHKPTEKMIDCYGYNPDFVFGDTLDGIGTEYNPAKFEDCILMQCTGLKDKNGKLIFLREIFSKKNILIVIKNNLNMLISKSDMMKNGVLIISKLLITITKKHFRSLISKKKMLKS